jgi:hypothetical protein
MDRDEKERAEKKAEQEAFASAMKRGDEPGFREYLTKYPNGPHASDVSARLAHIEHEKRKQAEQKAFTLATRTGTVEAYEEFLKTWPNSPHEQEARQRLKEARYPDNEAEEWEAVNTKQTLQAYFQFLDAFPKTKMFLASEVLSGIASNAMRTGQYSADRNNPIEVDASKGIPVGTTVPGIWMSNLSIKETNTGRRMETRSPQSTVGNRINCIIVIFSSEADPLVFDYSENRLHIALKYVDGSGYVLIKEDQKQEIWDFVESDQSREP